MTGRPEPKVGDVVLLKHRSATTIDSFDEDHGTFLKNYQWVCMSDFIWNTEANRWEHKNSFSPPSPEEAVRALLKWCTDTNPTRSGWADGYNNAREDVQGIIEGRIRRYFDE